jgi:hypothetical protein
MNVRVQTWTGEAWSDAGAWRVAGSRRQVVYLASDAGELLTFQRMTGYQRGSKPRRIHPDDMAALSALPMRSAALRSRDAGAYPEGGIVKRERGRPRADLTGRVVVRLTVLGPAPDCRARPHWRCQCACGNPAVILVSSDNLRAAERGKGGVGSCGCLRDEAARETARRAA